MPRLRDLALRGAHLAGLWALAFAQPLFDLLARNPASFFGRNGRWDVVASSLALVLAPPLLLLALEALAELASRALARLVHLLFVAALVALLAFLAVERVAEPVRLLAAVAVGAAAAAAYARMRVVRLFATFLSPAAVAVVALFLFHSPVATFVLAEEAEAAAASVGNPVPVVVLVLDEFPLTALLDASGAIDARRYPGFARLAREATWFRGATTVHDFTEWAVPAVLTGRYPRNDQIPFARDHPGNLFTLLGGTYRMEVRERVTQLCPKRLCPRRGGASFRRRVRDMVSDFTRLYLATRISPRLGGRAHRRDEPRLFARFLASLVPRREPTLHFGHFLLPHNPWEYLPSGRRYQLDGRLPSGLDPKTLRWREDERLAVQGYARFLAQAGFVDRLVGRLLARLRATGLYERSLVIVTSDHGSSFRASTRLRVVKRENVEDVASVPLFVKRPGQRRGEVVDAPARTIDVLPTIAEVLGVRVPWRTDGVSLFARRPPPAVLRILSISGHEVTVTPTALRRRREAAVRRKLALFGAAPLALFGTGPYRALVGRRTDSLAGRPAAARVRVRGGTRRRVDPRSPFVPALVEARIVGRGARSIADVAVAVHGRIGAVAPTFADSGGVRFSALLAESTLRPGGNELKVYAVASQRGEPVLAPLPADSN